MYSGSPLENSAAGRLAWTPSFEASNGARDECIHDLSMGVQRAEGNHHPGSTTVPWLTPAPATPL